MQINNSRNVKNKKIPSKGNVSIKKHTTNDVILTGSEPETASHAFDHVGKMIAGQGVPVAAPLFDLLDDTDAFQNLELLADDRLRITEYLGQFHDSQLVVPESIDNPDAYWIAETLENFRGLFQQFIVERFVRHRDHLLNGKSIVI